MVEQAQERCAMVEPVERQITGKLELAHLKIGSAGIGVHLKRSVRRAQETCNLAGKLHNVVHHVRQRDKCWQPRALAHGRAQDRAIARRVIAVVAQELEITLERITAAQRRECRRVVVGHRMVHAAHDRQTVHDPCCLGQVLADPNPWHGGRDRAELAADLRRGIRLHVICVDMAGPAVMEDQDARADRRQGLPRQPSPCFDESPRASARSRAGSVNPSEPNPPTRSNWRRLSIR